MSSFLHKGLAHIPGLFSASVSGGGPSGDLLNGLVAWWELDETQQGSTRADSSNNGYDLVETLSSPIISAQNKVSGSSIRAGSNAALEDSNVDRYRIDTFYCSMWLYVSSSDQATGLPYIMGVWQPTGGQRSWAILYNYATQVFLLYVSDTGAFDTSNTLTTTTVTMGRDSWNLVEFYFDGPNNELGVSINNGTFETTTVPASSIYKGSVTGNVTFMLGGRPSDTPGGSFPSVAFRSLVDQAVIWNRLLTPTERDQLWNSGDGVAFTQL